MSTASERPRGATRADVARLAGVSTAVVSYTLNGGPKPVAAATRERVLEAVRKLEYRPNAAARALSLGRTDLIGLVVPTVEQPYFAHLTSVVESAARRSGLSLVVANAAPADRIADVVRNLAGQQLRGILLAAEATPEATRELFASGIPTVLINQAAPIGALATLGPDYYQGAVIGVRHLIEVHGHRQVAYIGGNPESDERTRGWRDTVRAAGLEPGGVFAADYSLAGGRDAMLRMLREHPETTAAFIASDQLAAGAIAGLDAVGKRAPRDLAIVSFDGSPESEFTVPPLTTVDVHIEQMALDAVASLVDPDAGNHFDYETELIVRTSCGCDDGG